MIVQQFLKWVQGATVDQRVSAANALARGYIQSDLSVDERCAAEAALTLLLDDRSPKVRAAMAEPLSLAHAAPPQLITALAADQPEVAAMILVRSPLLSDGDLIDRVAGANATIQRLVAMRARLSQSVCAAIAETGEVEACLEMLGNEGADIADISFRRIAERHGSDASVRRALDAHLDLPADTRHFLLGKVGEALTQSPLLRGLMGQSRAARVVRDACVRASVSLVEHTKAEDYPALIEHLRLAGELTTGFVVRLAAHGKVDFLGDVLVALSGEREHRVRSLLANGRDNALRALLGASGLKAGAHAVILRALKVWREVARGTRLTGVQEVSWLMLKEIGGTPGSAHPAAENDNLVSLLKSIYIDQLRLNAKMHAVAIAAA